MRSLLVFSALALAIGLGMGLAPASAQTPDPTADPLATVAKPSEPKVKAESKKGKSAKAARASESPPADSAGLLPANPSAVPAPGGRNVTATGKTMPPAGGRAGAAPMKTSMEVEMAKAQKATEERNKAWDARMRRTMSTICNGC